MVLQDQLRAEKLLAEEKLLTFRPSINHYYHTSRPQLRLSNPAPYLAHVQSSALKRRESLLRMKAATEVCTSASVWSEVCLHVWRLLAQLVGNTALCDAHTFISPSVLST